MAKRINLSGQVFGRLTVDEYAGDIKGRSYWYCTCQCGSMALAETRYLRNGKAKSCGCFRKDHCKKVGKKTVHGGTRDESKTPEYIAWQNMRNRFPYVKEWDDFQQFFRDVGWRPADKYELSRHDIRQPHSKHNTYWSDPNEERTKRMQLDFADEFCIDMYGAEPDTRSATANQAREKEAVGVC